MGDFANKLASLLKGSPTTLPAQSQPLQAPDLGGLAGQAQQIIRSRPYQLHLQEAKAMGEQPLSPEDFMAQYMRQQGAGFNGMDTTGMGGRR